MKEGKQCPKCQSLRIGHLESVPDEAHGGIHQASIYASFSVWSGRKDSFGILHAYLCTDCGYYEQYVKDVRSLPYDKLRGFSWVNPEHTQEGPYR